MTLFGIPLKFRLFWSPPPPPAPWYPVKLGKRPAKQDARTLKFAKYVTTDLPQVPASCDYGDKVTNWGMLKNDVLGDCTCAGILHAIMLWLSQNGIVRSFTDSDAIALYERLCGYNPNNPSSDQGGVELDILKAWRKQPIADCQLLAFASVDPSNWEHVKLAHYLAGSLYMGVNLPLSAQKPGLWSDTSGEPGSWGGHALVTSAYTDPKRSLLCSLIKRDSGARLTAITWGTTQDMTPAWLETYCDELWVPITSDWFKEGKAPNGFNLAQLQADVAAISNNIN